jgi:D-erythronate 2-dehydrogenase
MKILITGGAGFIGKRLASQLLQVKSFAFRGMEPQTIDKVILFDNVEGENVPQDERVESITGDINDAGVIGKITQNVDLVWHLAAVVSAAAEADFDLGMNVNLDGLLVLLNTLRDLKSRPRLVFASSFAVFGGNMPDVVTDFTAVTPQSSYGTQKAIGELLVADYSRRGFIDGRIVRLPTITVRPGKPNKAASSFASSIIREPLAGKPVACPVRGTTKVYILSPRRAVESMLLAMQLSEATISSGRTIPLPGITVSVDEMVATLERIGGIQAKKLIAWEPDSEIQRIVDSWPACVDAARARELGFKADSDFEEIIRSHIDDELLLKTQPR